MNRESFIQLYVASTVGGSADDPIINAIAQEVFGPPTPPSIGDALNRFDCIYEDLSRFAEALVKRYPDGYETEGAVS